MRVEYDYENEYEYGMRVQKPLDVPRRIVPMPKVGMRRVREPRKPRDGKRVLVMRYWPRGVKKDQVDDWWRDLAPTKELIHGYKQGAIPWADFARSYRKQMRSAVPKQKISELAAQARKRKISVLCDCADETRCHRSLLKKMLEA